jgi:hypothetical protein
MGSRCLTVQRRKNKGYGRHICVDYIAYEYSHFAPLHPTSAPRHITQKVDYDHIMSPILKNLADEIHVSSVREFQKVVRRHRNTAIIISLALPFSFYLFTLVMSVLSNTDSYKVKL